MNIRHVLQRLALPAMALMLASCGSVQNITHRVGGLIEPYKVEVVQGNVVTREQLAVLQAGMNRNQVRDILGSPLITSLFHAQRWDYAFTIRRQGTEPLQRRVSVFFDNDRLLRFEADELPSEAEFTARIDSQIKGKVKIPKLQASAEELKPFLSKERSAVTPAPTPPAVNMAYPPLESR
jgi:outer membrane protein assembly factor BamE